MHDSAHRSIPSTSTGSTIHISSKLEGASLCRIQQMIQRRADRKDEHNDEECQPLLAQQFTRNDGTVTDLVVGHSTLPQTVFNSANVLIGISLLSLPLGLRYAGWVIGLGLLFLFAVATRYTGGILGKCLDVHMSLRNYGDIAYVAFGQRGRIATSILFNIELVCACVALVILFADSLNSLIPGYGVILWKILCGLILSPLIFFPMRWLSYTSFVGIFCVLAVGGVIVIDGLLKLDGLGSLRAPADTSMFPDNWAAVPLSFGLLMAPFGGHAVFPNIYRDMVEPWKYNNSLNYAFAFTWLADTCMATIGWIMFGNDTRDEITTNILLTEGYPKWLDILLLVFIAIIPITKFPLTCSPIISTFESLTGTAPHSICPKFISSSPLFTYTIRLSIRFFVVLLIVLVAIIIPSFEIISAILGAAFCFLICIVLPLAFHVKMFGQSLGTRRKMAEVAVMVLAAAMGIVGTAWEVLPKGWMGVDL